MAKHILKIRQLDKVVFDAINNGQKTVETRAATAKYRRIKVGDTLVFVCGGDRLERRVGSVAMYPSIEKMAAAIDFQSIMPFVDSAGDMRGIYHSFPGYQEKIQENGLVAFRLE